MSYLIQQLTDSWREMKRLKVLAVTAMLIALGVILGFFFSIQLTDYIRIGFSSIPNQLTALFFGPVVGGFMGGITDILKFIVKPTGPFFPGYTLNAMLGPVIYGFFFYHRPVTFRRILAAHIVVAVIVNLLLGTLWSSMLYGQAFMVLLPTKAIQQVLTVPVYSLVFYMVAKPLEKARVVQSVAA